MRVRTKAIVLGAIALTSCATPESRIETRLVAAGFSEGNAKCLANELTDRLTLSQLKTLNEVAKTIQNRQRVKRMTVGDLAAELGRVGDPKLIVEVSRAGLGCAILRG